MPKSTEERFWEKVNKDGPISEFAPHLGQCWIWTGAISMGYGNFGLGRRGSGTIRSHRFAYELMIGSIPDGMHIDHLCRVRSCVNPSHLEMVTQKENTNRGFSPSAILNRMGQCSRGHSLSGENLWVSPDGTKRRCRTCDKERGLRRTTRSRTAKRQPLI